MWSAANAHRRFATRPHPRPLIDLAIAVGALAASLALLDHGGVDFGDREHRSADLDWISGVLAACSTLPLIGSRRAPRAVFAVTASAVVLLGAAGYAIGLPLGPAVALYLLAASRDEAAPWTPITTATIGTLFVAYVVATAVAESEFPASELLHGGLAWGIAWFAGERTRLRRDHLADLTERARRAERDAERERRLAVAEERTRIARDLHDAAGHAISVIAMRSGTARLRRDTERSHAALEAIEELARKTAGEIDAIVGTLRDEGSAGEPVDAPPGLASLDTLVARHVAAGLRVSVAREGRPRPLEGVVDQAAYRILQEALTNAARYGRGQTHVGLAFGADALELTISNPTLANGTARATGGHGLIGMRERATLLGGNLDFDRASGTFRVRACLPYARPSR